MAHPLLNLAAGIVVGALGVRLARTLQSRRSGRPSTALDPDRTHSSLGAAEDLTPDSAHSSPSSGERSSALRARPEDLPDMTEFVVPSASNSVRKEPKVRAGGGKTSKAFSKTKPGQAPA